MGRFEDIEVWKSARGLSLLPCFHINNEQHCRRPRKILEKSFSIFHLQSLIKNVWAKAPGGVWHPNPGINAVASYPAQPAIRKRSPICKHLCCNLCEFVDNLNHPANQNDLYLDTLFFLHQTTKKSTPHGCFGCNFKCLVLYLCCLTKKYAYMFKMLSGNNYLPLARNIELIVLKNSFASSASDQLSMYWRSSCIHCSNLTSFLFGIICHVQVIPGFTDNLLNCQRSYSFTSDSRGGLGPISDISPDITLNN